MTASSDSNRPALVAGWLLLALVASFATLVPGGPVETRDFSGLGGLIFSGFNVFLVALGVTALAAAIGLIKGRLAFAWVAIGVCWGYVFVVLLDLGAVFPRSPDPIPLPLGLIEILDFILAFYVAALCHRALRHI
ncbi:hypothetical protein [Hoeflea sp. BAL378]|uniref:hypothetical protein n=1 Tax=Hoeflea sp. BAL378 TaxID=1547437 RepID=UPI000A8BC78C|nr:hypothetical protein [Hoeflea sp. BAL378]